MRYVTRENYIVDNTHIPNEVLDIILIISNNKNDIIF